VGSQSNVMNGAQACLDVTVQNFTNINSFQTTLTYNSTMLQNPVISNFGVAGMTAANFNTSTPGTIVVNWTNATAQTVASGGVLFRVCFTANAGSGSTQVTVGTSTATNASSQSVTVNSTPGTVTFSSSNTPTPIALTVGSQSNVMNGAQACLDVTVQNFTSINSFQTTLTYNSTMLQNPVISNFGVAGMTAANFNTSTPGTIVVNWTNATAQTVASGGVLFRVCFTANASSGSTQVTVGTSTATNASSQSVTVNSTAGTVSFTVPINPPVIATPANITNVNCFGASTGAIDISVSGGTGNYTYMWSYQNRTTQDLTNIPAGTYSVTVTDTGTNQTTSGSFTVTQPVSGISIIAIPTNVACTGASTGVITLNVSGGTGSYNYNWSGTLPDGVPSQSNLAAGTYSVTVTDGNNCTASQSVTITEPAGTPLTISSMVQPVVCGGASTGRITLTISGGTPNYSINWCCGLPANATTVSNLTAGTYNVTVTDNNGCTATRSINVGENPVLQISTITPTHINNGNDGAINITVTGGTGGYSFVWTGPAGFNGSNQPNLSGLNFPGQYCVTVTDNSGCTASRCVQLDERLRFGNVVIGRSCAGASSGSIQVSVLGGVGPYNYNWNPGGQAGSNRTNLAAGTYNVTVTDQVGGVLAGSFVVENFPTAVVSGTVVNASGNITDANGSVTLNISGGTPGYTINWAPGGTTGLVLSNVVTGQYCATVTDMAGCSVVQCFTVGFNPGPLAIVNTQTTPVTCPGDQNGALNITLNGGLPPFTFAFSDGFNQTINGVTLNRSNLPAGALTYTVTDAQGTVINGSATITASSVVTTTNIAVVHDLEEPGCTGSVTLTLTGGTLPYQLQWNTPNTGGPAINNLCAGTFIATVTDGNGCIFVLPGIEVNTFGLSSTSTATNCPGDATGAINLVVAGGRAPYTYEWRNAAGVIVSTDEDLANAAPGTYTVRVTEGSGNVLTRTYTIASQSALALDVDVTSNYNGFDVRCHDSADGSMAATAFNGQGNYTFEWRRNGTVVGGSGATLTNAAPGEYLVRVTDGLGCTVTETLTLQAPQPVTVTANTLPTSCTGVNDGQIFAAASGGVFALPYNYEWSNGAFGPRLTFLRVGSYTVTVNDVNNCTATATFSVSNPAPIVVTVNSTPATDGCNGSVLAVVTGGGEGPFTFTWSTGQVTAEPFLTGLCPGEYFVMVTDSRGCRPDPNLASGTVRDRRTPCLDIRTVITPDGDGLNEEFIISCVDEFANNHLEVYNRWGQLVYETDNYDNTWRGTTRNGSELPDGPYYFVFEYTDIDGIRQQLRGSITILRR
jgi:gliding motility-associated-like protein